MSRKATEKESESVECPTRKEPCRPLRKRERKFTILCGKIRINRWVYCCEQGHRQVQWEAKQKYRINHRVVEAMCRLSARLDDREASEELSHQGIAVSHTNLYQHLCKWSEDLNVCEHLETHKLEENQRWYVGCDGCHTNSWDGWKEVKAGCVYRDYPLHPNSSGAISRARTTSIRYVASREAASDFGKELLS